MIETNVSLIFWNTISGIIQNLPWFILFGLIGYLIIKEIRKSTKRISEGFNNLIKNIPAWLDSWDKIKMKHYKINQALKQ